MSMKTYPACGYGLVFTADQIEPLLKNIIAVRHANDPVEIQPENIYDAVDYLNEEDYDWFVIDENSDSNFSAFITRANQSPEELPYGLLYIPYGVKNMPWMQPRTTKDGYFDEIFEHIGDILPTNYSIEDNFVFACWCQFV